MPFAWKSRSSLTRYEGRKPGPTEAERLLLAVERLRAALGSSPSWFYYFPAYEIMMDELRDYRFYADDLLHPSSMAEEIIWQRFQQVLMTPQARDLVACNEKHARQQAHRPLH